MLNSTNFNMHITTRHTVAFVLCILIGIVGVVFCKVYSVGPIYSIAFPVLIVVSYFLYLTYCNMYLNEQAGDNIYYLGFLLTLTGLSVALYQFYFDSLSAETIVANFGLSLSGTIAGIALRIVYLNFNTDKSDIEEIARRELVENSQELTRQLKLSADEFISFRKKIQDDIETHHVATKEKFDDFSLNIIKSIKKILEENLEHFSIHIKQIQQELTSSLATYCECVSISLKNTSEINEALSKITADLSNVEIPKNLAKSRFDKIFGGFSEIAAQLQKEHTSAAQTIALSNNILSDTAKFVNTINDNITNLPQLIDSIGKTSSSFAVLSSSANNLADSFEIINHSQSDKYLKIIDSLSDKTTSSIEKYDQVILNFFKFLSSTEDTFKLISERQEKYAQDYSLKYTESINMLSNITSKEALILKDTISKLEEELNRSSQVTTRVVENFGQMTDLIITKINQ